MNPLAETYLLSAPLMLVLLTIATCDDLIEHRIPNAVVLWGIVLALGIGGLTGGHVGFIGAISGLLLGGLMLLPFYVLGGMGAGDVKLMAMAGAFLGPAATIVAVVVTLVAGLVLGLSVVGIWLLLRSAPGLVALAQLRSHLPRSLRPAYPGTKPAHFPYAAAIATGAAVAVFAPIPGIMPTLTG
ncbi:MAG: A24 family peptidase [Gammaproteobacteria bacterium]|nr:A24 family peptidase [Gammaproteobacteria bacterium]NNF59863.1 prepilin peptidase [Gammaproteobacteria bacterium]NNM21496.1 prepilin peptidase [Gammaproteobacteria bacterium]